MPTLRRKPRHQHARVALENPFILTDQLRCAASELALHEADALWFGPTYPALRDWLQTPEGASFRVRRDLELYGVSCHPEGFLQRLDGTHIRRLRHADLAVIDLEAELRHQRRLDVAHHLLGLHVALGENVLLAHFAQRRRDQPGVRRRGELRRDVHA